MTKRIICRSYLHTGRLIPKRAEGLRARSVKLKPGQVMDWHSTKNREELLIMLKGKCVVELQSSRGKQRSSIVTAGQSVFLSSNTLHRLVNQFRSIAAYIYVTGEGVR